MKQLGFSIGLYLIIDNQTQWFETDKTILLGLV
jgi:hypothetical protein